MLALMLLHCLRVLGLFREAVLALGLLKVTRMLLHAFLMTGVQEAETGIRYSSHTEIFCTVSLEIRDESKAVITDFILTH